jgi:hypothetical protein
VQILADANAQFVARVQLVLAGFTACHTYFGQSAGIILGEKFCDNARGAKPQATFILRPMCLRRSIRW